MTTYSRLPARAAALSQVGLPQDTDEPIDFAGSAALRGKLPNTQSETWTAGAGASIITDNGNLGISYSHYDSLYGVPIRYATAVGQEQEAPRLDVVQNRVDLRGEINTGGGFLDKIRVRAGHATYRHFELEPDGGVGTAFFNNGTEGRIELVQANRGGWQGASGVQYFNRLFDVNGDEAFLPRNETNQTGLFTVQQFDFGKVRAEGGLRYEASAIDGATPWQQFRHVTMPLLTPIIAVVMTFSVLFTFTDFQLIYVITRGGPLNATHLMATLSFQRAISGGALGEGAAIAIAMVPFLLACVMFSFFGLQRRAWQQGGTDK